jgi:hypothetical protein
VIGRMLEDELEDHPPPLHPSPNVFPSWSHEARL